MDQPLYHDGLDASDDTTNPATVEPARDPLDDARELTHRATVPVEIDPETAAAIAHRLGESVADAGGEPVLWEHARDMAVDYVDVSARVRVSGLDMPLAEFITEFAEVPIGDRHDTTPSMLAGPDAFDGIITAYQCLEQVPLNDVDHQIQSRVMNALEELDNAITTAAKNGQLQPASDD